MKTVFQQEQQTRNDPQRWRSGNRIGLAAARANAMRWMWGDWALAAAVACYAVLVVVCLACA